MYYIYRSDFDTYYKYRKAVSEARKVVFAVRNVCGGVVCFENQSEFGLWQNQK